MISKSERLLIFRFLFSKKSDGYVSIFAWFSIIGISLGVAAIIIVMSVMNGFRIDLTNRIIGLNSHLNIYSFDNEITKKQADELILNIDNSFFYQHYKSIETNGLIIKSNNSKGVMIKGYDEYGLWIYQPNFTIPKISNKNKTGTQKVEASILIPSILKLFQQ